MPSEVKLRRAPVERNAAWHNWQQLRGKSLGEIEVSPDHFKTAAGFCARPDLGLRAGDGLHLAIAQSAGLSLLTLDRSMAVAALQLGIPVEPF